MRRPERVTPAFCVRPAATWTTSVLSMGSRSGALSPPPHVYTDDSGGGMAGRAGPRGTPLHRALVVLLPVLPGVMGGPVAKGFSALWDRCGGHQDKDPP